MKRLAPLCLVACLASSAFANIALADVSIPCEEAAPLQTAGSAGAGGSGNPEPRPRNPCPDKKDDDDGCSIDRVGKVGGGPFRVGLAALIALAGASALFADRRRRG